MNRRELERLTQGMADCTLTAEEISTLEEELLTNPGSRDFYRRSMRVEQLLAESLHLGSPPASGEWMNAYMRRRQRKAMLRSALAAAAVLLVSALVLHHIFLREPDTTIRVAFSPGTSWSGSIGKDGKIAPGEPVRLEFGVAELNIPGQVRAVIEGPAEMVLRGPGLLELREGSGWFRVDESGRGFRVRTPSVEVVDLGTEFGLVTRPDELDVIHVFDGRVRCSARFAMKEERELRADESLRLSPVGRWIEQEPNEAMFLKSLPPKLPGIWFSFDGEDPLKPEGEYPAVKGMEVWTHGGGPAQLTEGVEGKALSLRERSDTVRTNWPGIGGAAPRTIACWIRPDGRNSPPFAGIVSWGNPSGSQLARCNFMIGKSRKSEARVLRFAVGRSTQFSGSTPIVAGEWQHIALVFRGTRNIDGDMVELYLNGEREQLNPEFSQLPKDDRVISTVIDSLKSQPLQIGCGPFPQSYGGRFFGDIDEVRILPRALSAREVKGLMGNRKAGADR